MADFGVPVALAPAFAVLVPCAELACAAALVTVRLAWWGSIGASALPDDLSWTVPHALSTFEIEKLVADFLRSAKLLAEAGFAGVEISAGHGHIFHQFMSAHSNRRDDRYGGDLAGRTRLLTELITGLRSECGKDFLIGVKLPGEDGVEGGVDMAEAARITTLVHATGAVDYLTYCWGSHAETLDWHLPDVHGPRVPYVEKIQELGRSAPGIPLGALGLITDPNEGERIVRDGLADLVMMGRPLVTDPAWGVKASQGREAQIRYCVSCNTCWQMISTNSTLQCDNNPRVGLADEADWWPAAAQSATRVVVVGAGIAGLEAAWVAAGRGCKVTVIGASDEVGGKARIQALLPGGESLSSIYDFQKLSADRYGVDFRLGAPATLEDILALDPQTVILATGATPSWPGGSASRSSRGSRSWRTRRPGGFSSESPGRTERARPPAGSSTSSPRAASTRLRSSGRSCARARRPRRRPISAGWTRRSSSRPTSTPATSMHTIPRWRS